VTVLLVSSTGTRVRNMSGVLARVRYAATCSDDSDNVYIPCALPIN
jgi:hypothetical protein